MIKPLSDIILMGDKLNPLQIAELVMKINEIIEKLNELEGGSNE